MDTAGVYGSVDVSGRRRGRKGQSGDGLSRTPVERRPGTTRVRDRTRIETVRTRVETSFLGTLRCVIPSLSSPDPSLRSRYSLRWGDSEIKE